MIKGFVIFKAGNEEGSTSERFKLITVHYQHYFYYWSNIKYHGMFRIIKGLWIK